MAKELDEKRQATNEKLEAAEKRHLAAVEAEKRRKEEIMRDEKEQADYKM